MGVGEEEAIFVVAGRGCAVCGAWHWLQRGFFVPPPGCSTRGKWPALWAAEPYYVSYFCVDLVDNGAAGTHRCLRCVVRSGLAGSGRAGGDEEGDAGRLMLKGCDCASGRGQGERRPKPLNTLRDLLHQYQHKLE